MRWNCWVQAGFTPLEALQAATRNPALFLREAEMGTVETGKLANLILLEGDPLQDIRNTQRIYAVILNGKYLSKARLKSLLAEAEELAKKP